MASLHNYCEIFRREHTELSKCSKLIGGQWFIIDRDGRGGGGGEGHRWNPSTSCVCELFDPMWNRAKVRN